MNFRLYYHFILEDKKNIFCRKKVYQFSGSRNYMVREQIYTEVAFAVQTVALKNYCPSIHQNDGYYFQLFMLL